MRVSTRMFENNYLAELDRQQEQVFRLQQQIASGKRMLDPSDDPAAAKEATGLHAQQAALEQYQTNLGDAQSQVDHSESVAGNVRDLVDQVQQLAERGASDSITPDGRKSLAQQVNQLIEEVYSNANDSTEGQYTFAGVNSTTAPYVAVRDAQGNITSVAASGAGTGGDIDRQVGKSTTLKVNLNGSDVFGGAGAPAGTMDAFATLIQLRDALNANDTDTVRAAVTQLGSLHDQVQTQVTVADSRAQRLTQIQTTLQQQQTEGVTNLSRLEGLDTAKAALDLQGEQVIYQQALSIGSKILSLGLGTLQG